MNLSKIAEQWRAMSLRDRLIIASLLPLAVVLLFWFYIVTPKTDEIKSLEKEIKTKRDQLIQYRSLLMGRELKVLETKLSELNEKLQKKEKEIPYITEIYKLNYVLSRINSVFTYEGLIITRAEVYPAESVKYILKDKKLVRVAEEPPQKKRLKKKKEGKEKAVKSYKVLAVPIKMGVYGNAFALNRALNKIIESNIIFVPKSLVLNPSEGGNSYGFLEAELVFMDTSDSTD